MSARRAPSRRARIAAVAAMAVTVLVVGACTGSTGPIRPTVVPSSAPTAPPSATRPNIVFVLTDDLSTDLLRFMPHVRALAKRGMTFTNYIVADSLCCPSRASIMTGDYPHTTQIVNNVRGFEKFTNRGEEKNSFAIPILAQGYRTAFMGKYLNKYYAEYPAPKAMGDWTPPKDTYVPPGWTEWDAVGLGYKQYDYSINHDHKVIHHRHRPEDYLNSVLLKYGRRFIAHSVAAKTPFMLEIASFSPHTPNIPAPRDVHKFPHLDAPRDAAFNRVPTNAPSWLAHRPPFTKADIVRINRRERMRARAVQAVDRMVASLERKLAATGQLQNTIFMFSSDNGYHEGQYRLLPGKLTAFDTDVNVPLIVAGPGIKAGSVNNNIVQNVDLAPTFEELTGAKPPASVEGRSFVPLLHGAKVPWRSLGLIEHSGPDTLPGDPDVQTIAEGNPPTYDALRSPTFTYVKYANGQMEYYDRTRDPLELDNIANQLPAARIAQLNSWLDALHTCASAAQCWQAGRPSTGV